VFTAAMVYAARPDEPSPFPPPPPQAQTSAESPAIPRVRDIDMAFSSGVGDNSPRGFCCFGSLHMQSNFAECNYY
jgi:hypothetical protein